MVFISYRKADTQAIVDRLADKLKQVFGAAGVFKDDRDLRAGERWPDRLKREVLARDVLLAVIGPHWLTALDEDGRRRLDDSQDWVRQEIGTALDNGKRVIVLLVDAARMPTQKGLPADCPLQQLPDLQALKLRSGADSDADLARLIEELRSSQPAAPTPCAPSARPLPPRPLVCFGREAPMADLLGTLLPADLGAKVMATSVGGIGGIGKSTFVLTAMHDEGVAARYAERRHFVRLDGASSRSGVAAAVAESVGLPLGDALEARLLILLGRGGPRLLALDNAETPLLADDRTETEELLGNLAAVSTLAVVTTLRGTHSLGPGWRRPIELRRLDDGAARETFLAGTSGQFANDPALDGVLRELDGWPLAVMLLAYQARFYADLKELTDAWRKKRAGLLTKGVKKREADIGASIEMSLGCPLLTADARRLLALLGFLPDGIRRADLVELLPPDGAEAAVALRRVGGLAFDDGPRMRVLAPVREYLEANHPPAVADRERAIAFFCRLAEVEGNRVGMDGGADASARLGAESANLVAMIRLGLRAPDPEPAFKGALGLGRFSRFSGVDLSAALVAAAQAAREAAKVQRQGDCIQALGDIARRRSRSAEARRCYEEARSLCQEAGDVRGEASCIRGLGDIAVDHSDHAEARRRYEEARPLCQEAGDVRGEANCIRGLGDIALRASDHVVARRRYEEARLLFRSVGSVSGEATCTWRLGDIAAHSPDHAGAGRHYEEARQLFMSVGDIRGEATCIQRLGDLALSRSNHDEARHCYEQAGPMFQKVGEVRGEANCVRGLGGVAQKEGNLTSARQLFEQALALYHRIEEPYSIGLTHRLMAHIADPAERQRQAHAARAAWLRLDRPDLVAQLDREFGSPPASESP